ncbi:uncharacterized protein C22orf15 homolog isoform X4 [Vidua chalybeata]|uniref:uncharacterized protein C22orf15 homolog isoform X4 n=1 Tax=Vidua chalybeata TaxID=81927 RepID=UPI0023A848F0|nr:uncharacterized protein C22orf15 homolog isoform X4 [Vidua chalybeata]
MSSCRRLEKLQGPFTVAGQPGYRNDNGVGGAEARVSRALQQLPALPAGRDPAPRPCQGYGSTMFATVRFGANCQEMVNLLCCVRTLTAHLKWKCQCRPEDCIDLMDEKGTLMNLSKVEDPASEYASKYLQGRQRYILVRAVREENPEATCYESLLEDLGKHYPDLPGLLWAVRAVRHQGRGQAGLLCRTPPI